MPKIGEKRTKVSYVEAIDIRNMLGLTGSMITGAVGTSLLSRLANKLAQKLVIVGAFSSPFVKEVVNQLTNKKLSQYKVKFTTTEQWVYEKVFDTHEWIDAYMWRHLGTKFQVIKK